MNETVGNHGCWNCRWAKVVEDSEGKNLCICVNCESAFYHDFICILGECVDWVDEMEGNEDENRT